MKDVASFVADAEAVGAGAAPRAGGANRASRQAQARWGALSTAALEFCHPRLGRPPTIPQFGLRSVIP